MKPRTLFSITTLGLAQALAFLYACGGSQAGNVKQRQAAGIAQNGDDRSHCDFKGRTDREATQSVGPGSVSPNIRRVYSVVGNGEDQHRALICREVDTNLDGVKDV